MDMHTRTVQLIQSSIWDRVLVLGWCLNRRAPIVPYCVCIAVFVPAHIYVRVYDRVSTDVFFVFGKYLIGLIDTIWRTFETMPKYLIIFWFLLGNSFFSFIALRYFALPFSIFCLYGLKNYYTPLLTLRSRAMLSQPVMIVN